MESGVNPADQNFRSRRQPSQSQSPEYHHPPPPDFDSRSPPRPPKIATGSVSSLTSENLAAVTSDGFTRDALSSGEDPADFYRGVHGANGYSHQSRYNMAATASDSRPQPSTLRSNGNGTTPKHPPLPHARAGLKPTLRSASSPLDRPGLSNAKSTSALNGFPASRQLSVRDLAKRYDPNVVQVPPPPKPAPRINTRNVTPPSFVKDRISTTRSGSNLNAPAAARPGAASNSATGKQRSPPQPRPTQRARFAAEDQHSNNTLSSATRTTRPRTSVSGNKPQFSKSMTNLSPTSSEHPRPTRRPLFGEVLPVQGNPNIGYGIPQRSVPRRTSDSSLHPPSSHLRRHSDLEDISPTSPTAWYLGVTPELDDVDPYKRSRLSGHNRSHSDFADNKANTMNGVNPSFQTSNPPTTSAAPTTSRLPVSRHRVSSSSETSPITLSHAPFSVKISNGKLGKPEQQQRPWSPAGRATTPISRAKTPTYQSPRGKARIPEKSTSNNASLRAYVSVPLPKTSPPLRSSHSRAPISTATTSSSKPKTGDRSSPPQQIRTGMKLIRNNAEAKDTRGRERKIPDVPLGSIDFGAKKAQVRRAYTNSINKSEQEAIRAENYRRLQVKNAVIARENQEQASQATSSAEKPPPTKAPPPQPLQIDTSFQKPPHVIVRGYDPATGDDSPTLGMPGSYVDDYEPPSAISNATGITEFDNEPQTEAARLSRIPSHRSALSSHVQYSEDLMSPDQALYGMMNMDQESINIMLDATPAEESQAEPTPTNDDFGTDPSPPGAFQPDEDYFEQEQPVFASTLTTASPMDVTSSDFDRRETRHTGGNDSHSQATPAIYLSNETQPLAVDFNEAPRLELPFLRTALSPPSEGGEDGFNTPATDMEYESSEVGGPSRDEPDLYGSAYDSAREGLTSPQQYTFSAHSSWRTDDSIEAGEDEARRDGFDDQDATPGSDDKPTPPPKEPLISPAVPPKPEGYSPLPSPRFQNDIHRIPSPQLPPVATGEGFSFAFPDDSPGYGTATTPQWPDHAPPAPPGAEVARQTTRSPPPPSSFYNRRPPSSVYQNGRDTESRRASDDVYSPRPSLSTPRSSTQISLEETDLALKPKSIADVAETEEEKQERKRLYQRKMVINELIDTEAVYLKDLNVVEEIYKGTAEACPRLEPNDIKQLFRNSDEVVKFSATFLEDLKAAAGAVYSPRRTNKGKGPPPSKTPEEAGASGGGARIEDSDAWKDRQTSIGACFKKNLTEMERIYADFLKNSEVASTRLEVLQKDELVKVWLGECNTVAKDLTAAWDLDALLVKPVQRLTRYPLMLSAMLKETPEDHPDIEALRATSIDLAKLLGDIDELKKRINMVGKIVQRKRKESDTRSGISKLLGSRANKMIVNPDRMKDDKEYAKAQETFNNEFFQLQVVLRDFEYYTRSVAVWVKDFLQLTAAMELTIRCVPSQWPEMESKWIRYNLSLRDLGGHVLADHIGEIREKIINTIEKLIATYSAPALAMKRRDKRRLDFEKWQDLTAQKKTISKDLSEKVDEYHALNETLKHELPKLSSATKTINVASLAQFVHIQEKWLGVWAPKVKSCLEESQIPKTIAELVEMFYRDFKYSEAQIAALPILSGERPSGPSTNRPSESTFRTESSRTRGLSIASDRSPVLPAPDFQKRLSAGFNHSPIFSPSQPGLQFPSYQPSSHSRVNSNSPATPDGASSSGSRPHAGRPNTGRSFTSDSGMRPSNDHNTSYRRESGSTYNSASHYVDGPPISMRPQSGLFHSAMPMGEGNEESQRSSRASSRDRNTSGGYFVLYLAASLFEFNIAGTKQEAGYPYLTYSAGEIFDVIGEKGELWLAKNQDDPQDRVGWIWSKHFARLAAN